MAPVDLFDLDVLRSYLLIGARLGLGMLGFLTRRNLIVMFLSAEMMLQGTALSLVAFGRYHGTWTGQIFTIMILTVAACESSIALALIVILFNRRSSLDVTLWQDIREEARRRKPPTTSFPRPSRSKQRPARGHTHTQPRASSQTIRFRRGSSGGIESGASFRVAFECDRAFDGIDLGRGEGVV